MSGTSPTFQGKDKIRHLNDRLANYIQRVIDLESERLSINLLLDEKEDIRTKEVDHVRQLYEEELAEVRKSLDELSNERASFQADYDNLHEDHMKLKARNQKKEDDLGDAVHHWRNMEAALNKKEADYTNQLVKNRRLNSDAIDLRTQLGDFNALLTDIKTQLNSETMKRVDTENQLETFKQQLHFQRNISEQEILDLRNQHDNSLVDLDSGRRREFESKLARAMHELRQEHDVQIQLYKEELERNFNAQQAALRRKSEVVSVAKRDELIAAKDRADDLSSEVQQYQKETGTLANRVRELERTLDREHEMSLQRLHQKEQDMLTMQSQMHSHLEEFEKLLESKLELDMDISAYRKLILLLEREEQRREEHRWEEHRQQQSPSPSHGSRMRGSKWKG